MENLWITSGDQVAHWYAYLGPPDDPGRLRRWVSRVLDAGAEHEVYRVREAPLAGYRAERDGDFDAWLEGRWRADGVVDVGRFAGSGMREVDGARLRVAARVAHADATGAVVETDTDDLGALLRSLRPGDRAEGGLYMVGAPPVDIDGPLVDTRDPDGSWWPGRPGQVTVHVSLRSDIWFPWVLGILAAGRDGTPGGWFDNRPLAERHTPRLNAFLGEVRAATLDAGGRWELDENTVSAFTGPLTEAGVDLAVPGPPGPPG